MLQEAFTHRSRNDGTLYRAVKRDDQTTVITELRRGDVDPNLIIRDRSLIWHAGSRGFNQIVRVLADHGGDVDWKYGKQQRSLLHFAVGTGNYGFVCSLLDCGANPSPQTISGATPLHYASRTGMGYIARRLLEAGAAVHSRDRLGRSPLDLAMSNGQAEIIRQLQHREAERLPGEEQGAFPHVAEARISNGP